MSFKGKLLAISLAVSSCISTGSKDADVDLIDAQYAAYNSRDINRFLGYFSESARICIVPANLCLEGEEQIEAHFSDFFSKFVRLEAKVSKRIIDRDYILDWEHVAAKTTSGETIKPSAISVYKVQNKKIVSLTIFLHDK